VTLEENQVATVRLGGRVPEPRKADVIERGGRGEGGDVAADVGILVGTNDHGHGVPADVVVNLDFEVGIARVFRLLVDRNRIDVFGCCAVGDVDSLFARLLDHAFDQVVRTVGAFLVDDATERVLPFLRFLRIGVNAADRLGVLGLCCHGLSPRLKNVFVLRTDLAAALG
jgi:hypothetical protein